MLKINDVAVDVATGEPVLITNGIGRDLKRPDEYDPYEGLVFVMDGPTLRTWRIRNIEARELRPATEAERDSLMTQFQIRLEEIRKERPRRRRFASQGT